MVDTTDSHGNNDSFSQALKAAREVKDKYVNSRIHWYETHTTAPRNIYRLVGVSTIILSVTLPALSSADFDHKGLVISAMSFGAKEE